MEWKIICLKEADSTNRWLKIRSSTSPVVVTAEYQTAGKGCGANKWESERGKNLLFSVLLHPVTTAVREQFRISMAVSVALCEMLADYADGFSIKWPNDIYWNDRKICGILIENVVKGNVLVDSIVGVGLNVNQKVFVSDAPNPVSLCQIVGHECDRNRLLTDFLERLETMMERATLAADYERLLFRRHQMAAYADGAGTFRATIQGVAPDGCLRMTDTDGRERKYAFKEIQFIITQNEI